MLLGLLDKLRKDSVASFLQNGFLQRKTAGNDGGDHDVKAGERLSGGFSLIGHLQDGDRILVYDGIVVLPRPQLQTSVFAEASLVDLGVANCFNHCAATKTID